MDVIVGPELLIGTGGAEFVAFATKRMEKQRRAPAINQLALRIERNAVVRQEAFAGGVLGQG